MIEFITNHSNKLRVARLGLFLAICITLLLILPSLILTNPKAQAAASKPAAVAKDPSSNDGPNVITEGLFSSAKGIQKAANSTQLAVYNSSRTIRTSIVAATTASARFIGHSLASGAVFTIHAISSSARFVGHVSAKTFALASNITKIGSVITPAKAYNAPLPTIDPKLVALANSQSPSQTETTTAQTTEAPPVSTAPQWPIAGEVTLEFGVPHWPFQPTHTGIDISDGKPQGVTPVHPFEPGIVIQAVHSSIGFGNHVVIDHGNGITSLYGHMYSLSVQVGQRVDESTVLGTEGNTGASEGVHVHFEIDVNGVPTNPRKFVGGQP